ncbi:MAG: flagellar FliJ family protein [Desulfobacula sp.]|nr:flagellar FliJ family protein [Desulfobacula sp.]
MKRFQFKLESLLNYRKYLERLAQQETARAQMDVKTCEAAIVQLKAVFHQQSNQIEEVLLKGMTASQFRQSHDYLDAVKNQIEGGNRRKTQLKGILKEKVKKLKKKSIDKKAMELYREKQKEIYTQEFIKLEQKEQDEISSLKTARKISNGTN